MAVVENMQWVLNLLLSSEFWELPYPFFATTVVKCPTSKSWTQDAARKVSVKHRNTSAHPSAFIFFFFFLTPSGAAGSGFLPCEKSRQLLIRVSRVFSHASSCSRLR